MPFGSTEIIQELRADLEARDQQIAKLVALLITGVQIAAEQDARIKEILALMAEQDERLKILKASFDFLLNKQEEKP